MVTAVAVTHILCFFFNIYLNLKTGVGIAKVSSHVRSQKDAASLVTEAGMGHAVISSVLKDSLVKTAKRSVPLVKMVTTATLYMASAPTVTPAGLGTGKNEYTALVITPV